MSEQRDWARQYRLSKRLWHYQSRGRAMTAAAPSMYPDSIKVAFADKEVTCMTVWNGEFVRAIRLARAAYESRKRRPSPGIIAMRYIQDDGTVVTLSGMDLAFMLVMAGENWREQMGLPPEGPR